VRVAGIDRQLDLYVQRQLQVETSGGAYAGLRAEFYERRRARTARSRPRSTSSRPRSRRCRRAPSPARSAPACSAPPSC
jgi:hypothetical protein